MSREEELKQLKVDIANMAISDAKFVHEQVMGGFDLIEEWEKKRVRGSDTTLRITSPKNDEERDMELHYQSSETSARSEE